MTTDDSSTKKSTTGFVDDERGKVALRATYEIEALLDIIIEKSKNKESEDVREIKDIARGLSCRIKDLNSVVMSAIGDDLENNESLLLRAGH